MSKHFLIEHEGVVAAIQDDHVTVQIEATLACGNCEAKSACMLAEDGYRYIDVPCDEKSYKIGDHVIVVSDSSQRLKAAWWGYGLPVLVLLAVLSAALVILKNELLAGLAACVGLLLYYAGLFLFREHFKKIFTFKIKNPQ